jgi:hypothetical protein
MGVFVNMSGRDSVVIFCGGEERGSILCLAGGPRRAVESPKVLSAKNTGGVSSRGVIAEEEFRRGKRKESEERGNVHCCEGVNWEKRSFGGFLLSGRWYTGGAALEDFILIGP